jgi:hypothetical protein
MKLTTSLLLLATTSFVYSSELNNDNNKQKTHQTPIRTDAPKLITPDGGCIVQTEENKDLFTLTLYLYQYNQSLINFNHSVSTMNQYLKNQIEKSNNNDDNNNVSQKDHNKHTNLDKKTSIKNSETVKKNTRHEEKSDQTSQSQPKKLLPKTDGSKKISKETESIKNIKVLTRTHTQTKQQETINKLTHNVRYYENELSYYENQNSFYAKENKALMKALSALRDNPNSPHIDGKNIEIDNLKYKIEEKDIEIREKDNKIHDIEDKNKVLNSYIKSLEKENNFLKSKEKNLINEKSKNTHEKQNKKDIDIDTEERIKKAIEEGIKNSKENLKITHEKQKRKLSEKHKKEKEKMIEEMIIEKSGLIEELEDYASQKCLYQALKYDLHYRMVDFSTLIFKPLEKQLLNLINEHHSTNDALKKSLTENLHFITTYYTTPTPEKSFVTSAVNVDKKKFLHEEQNNEKWIEYKNFLKNPKNAKIINEHKNLLNKNKNSINKNVKIEEISEKE